AQRVLVNFLLDKEKIYSDEGEVIYENIIKVKLNKNAREEIEIEKEVFFDELKKEKKFLIDLSLFELHSRKGKSSLRVQVSNTLSIIRDFLFDTNLILVGDIDYSFLGKNIVLKYRKIGDVDIENYKAIILDPKGEILFDERTLREYELFLIGGIVDVGLEWEGGTSYLFRNIDLPRARIELEGSIRGVPDRINILIKILLESYYLNIPLRNAIVRNQGKKDILNRLWYEIKKYSNGKTIRREDIDNILRNLNLSREKLIEFLEKNNFKIV
ncbi:hypothetical protein BA065_02995, partial [Nanoarchaeota archaeon NZ13-N]